MAPTKAATFRIPDKCNIAVEENAEVWKQKYESEKNSHLSVFSSGVARAQPMPGHSMGTSLVPRPRPAFSGLQYGNAEATRGSGGFWDAHSKKIWNF